MEAPRTEQPGVFTIRHTIELDSPETPGRTTHLAQLVAALPERYVYKREIGKGGAAHVLLVHDTERDEQVAVKILRPEITTVLGRKRFQRGPSLTKAFETKS